LIPLDKEITPLLSERQNPFGCPWKLHYCPPGKILPAPMVTSTFKQTS